MTFSWAVDMDLYCVRKSGNKWTTNQIMISVDNHSTMSLIMKLTEVLFIDPRHIITGLIIVTSVAMHSTIMQVEREIHTLARIVFLAHKRIAIGVCIWLTSEMDALLSDWSSRKGNKFCRDENKMMERILAKAAGSIIDASGTNHHTMIQCESAALPSDLLTPSSL